MVVGLLMTVVEYDKYIVRSLALNNIVITLIVMAIAMGIAMGLWHYKW
jgi:ribose/xylose/arabinose/galactoside ABC-type transport system permease subunit